MKTYKTLQSISAAALKKTGLFNNISISKKGDILVFRIKDSIAPDLATPVLVDDIEYKMNHSLFPIFKARGKAIVTAVERSYRPGRVDSKSIMSTNHTMVRMALV